MNFKTPLTPTIILFFFYFVASAQTIDRGPYLQLTTTSSIFIHWRTDSPTDTKVWYGDDPNSLDQTLSSSTEVENHEILIPGLASNTVYYYAVGDGDGQMAGGDSDHYFKTAPSSSQPINVWVLGDAGKKNDDQRAVRDAYYNFIGNAPIDMMLLLGDNAYNDGDQDEYQEAWFENMYEDRLINSVMWPTFGNHDGNSADSNTETGPYYDIFNLPKNGQAGGYASGTEAYYSFDYGNMHIICLNSHDIDASSNSPMINWLQNDVDANTKEWTIAMFHHPAYRGSVYDIEANALPILEDGGVDLVIWGHYHRYERSFLIHGHYGSSGSYDSETMTIDEGDGRMDGDGAYMKNENGEGTIFVNTGSAGSASSGSSSHPIMAHNAGILGSVHLDVDGSQMDVKFIDSNGNIEDYFTIMQNVPLPVELMNFAAQTIGREIKLNWTTASEINNDFFTLERSIDGRSFQEIGTIPGKGNTTEISEYHYLDKNPKTGINYYRLKQTDFDGDFIYSNVVNATINSENHLKVYPSAVDNMITIEAGFEYEEEMTVVIYDIIGRSHKTFNFSTKENKTELLLTDLQPGTYILSISDSKINESFKFIKL